MRGRVFTRVRFVSALHSMAMIHFTEFQLCQSLNNLVGVSITAVNHGMEMPIPGTGDPVMRPLTKRYLNRKSFC